MSKKINRRGALKSKFNLTCNDSGVAYRMGPDGYVPTKDKTRKNASPYPKFLVCHVTGKKLLTTPEAFMVALSASGKSPRKFLASYVGREGRRILRERAAAENKDVFVKHRRTRRSSCETAKAKAISFIRNEMQKKMRMVERKFAAIDKAEMTIKRLRAELFG